MTQHQRAPPGPNPGGDGISMLCPFHISLRWCTSAQMNTGPQKSDPLTFVLAAHLLQQMVDARASEHVENFASTASIDM